MAKVAEVYPGAKFSRLTVVEVVRRNRCKPRRGTIPIAVCRCDCGNTVETDVWKLGGNTRSCGCLHIDTITKHGMSKKDKRLFFIWANMISRCEKESDHSYKDYGGKGVTVCRDWHDIEKFFAWASASGYTDDLTIDRIDPTGDYEPSNCRWLSKAAQMGNRRNAQKYTAWGETKTVAEWLKDLRCIVKNRRLIRSRVHIHKWDVERAMTEAVK